MVISCMTSVDGYYLIVQGTYEKKRRRNKCIVIGIKLISLTIWDRDLIIIMYNIFILCHEKLVGRHKQSTL